MNKKLVLLIFSFLLMTNSAVFAQNSIIAVPAQVTKTLFQTNLETEISDAIEQIYGEVYAPEIYEKVLQIPKKAI